MKVLAIGASRNLGYFAALNILKGDESCTVGFQLRNVSAFDEDAEMQQFVKSGRAKLIKGDALVEDDVRKTWNEANADAIPVDVVLFTVGGTPKFTLTRGLVIDPPNLCTSALLNVLSTLPRTQPQPKLIAITSNGVTPSTHGGLPFLSRAFYALITVPHADKFGMERALYWSAGWAWKESDGEPEAHILPHDWQARLGGQEGWLKDVVVVRPAILTDGVETGKWKAGVELPGLWTVSRKDVAKFVSDEVLKEGKWDGKPVSVGY
ncbi:hypothetical protein FRB90_000209 [Tulasnella sp. 427]|nr:hypothetical protein FRB90_000209 [Tulasnella sp. 427]